MIALVMAAWLLTGGFHESSTCVVQGYIYGMPDEASTFTRADGCQEIKATVTENVLLLTSPQTWVAIILPTHGGNHRLMYRWGAEFAHIGPIDQRVAFGPIVQG